MAPRLCQGHRHRSSRKVVALSRVPRGLPTQPGAWSLPPGSPNSPNKTRPPPRAVHPRADGAATHLGQDEERLFPVPGCRVAKPEVVLPLPGPLPKLPYFPQAWPLHTGLTETPLQGSLSSPSPGHLRTTKRPEIVMRILPRQCHPRERCGQWNPGSLEVASGKLPEFKGAPNK